MYPFSLPVIPNENEMVLILAGDIMLAANPLRSFFENVCDRHKYVLYIAGNHEFYHSEYSKALDILDSFGNKYDNLIYGNNKRVVLDGTSFALTTLWSSFDNRNPNSMWNAQCHMNDYHIINHGSRKLQPIDTFYKFETSIEFLAETSIDVIVSHHAPSFQSVSPIYDTDKLNGAYASNLEELILDKQPKLKLWIHGHMHHTTDYYIGDTRILANPRGYGDENKFFNPNLLVEI
jgi:Icc-related predicted phosphoesterase